MRSRALLFVIAVLLSAAADAQVMWQPTEPPLVTADNETWYRAGSAIEWNGEFYYPAGAPEAFNRYQMVRAGSYRGIPLYTDTTLEPYSIVFVPIAGGRMQRYERPRSGMLAGSVGSRSPSFPTAAQQNGALSVTSQGYVAQAPAPPMLARGYDLGPPPAPAPVATSGRSDTETSSRPAATTGRVTTVTNRTASAARPKGINGAWIEYGGRRWASVGKAVDITDAFIQVGQYRGSPIYQFRGDTSTIYVPTTTGLAAPFKARD